jgi:hypothetical protein
MPRKRRPGEPLLCEQLRVSSGEAETELYPDPDIDITVVMMDPPSIVKYVAGPTLRTIYSYPKERDSIQEHSLFSPPKKGGQRKKPEKSGCLIL